MRKNDVKNGKMGVFLYMRGRNQAKTMLQLVR